jgi:hypothetical protein
MLSSRVGEECWEERWANAGSWSLEENLRYALFIDLNKKSMTSKKKMRLILPYPEKCSSMISSQDSSPPEPSHSAAATIRRCSISSNTSARSSNFSKIKSESRPTKLAFSRPLKFSRTCRTPRPRQLRRTLFPWLQGLPSQVQPS